MSRRFPSTSLPMSNDPTEIRKGMLDLLDKINAVSPAAVSGQSIKSVSEDYYFGTDDGVTDLFVTTSSGTVTVYLDKSSRNIGRVLRVWKADSGTGEVKVTGWNGTETISGYANVYVGLQYQHADIYQDGTTNFNIGQYIQPVAGEPSCGTAHPTKYANRSTSYVVDTSTNTAGTWSAAVTMPNVPSGARAAWCMANCYKASANPVLTVEAATGYTLDDTTSGNNFRKYVFLVSSVTSSGQWGLIKINLDSNLQFKWCTNTSNSTVQICSPIYYEM